MTPAEKVEWERMNALLDVVMGRALPDGATDLQRDMFGRALLARAAGMVATNHKLGVAGYESPGAVIGDYGYRFASAVMVGIKSGPSVKLDGENPAFDFRSMMRGPRR